MAQVALLDKQKGTINQLTSPSSVDNDLVINAYKPGRLHAALPLDCRPGLEADFVPSTCSNSPGRQRRTQPGDALLQVPGLLRPARLPGGLQRRPVLPALGQWGCVERDGYWFADEAQANEYEKRQAGAFGGTAKGKRGATQAQAVLFISDERSARQWLWGFLATPQSYSDIYTAYTKALQTSEDELPKLRTMLEEGFLQVGSLWRRPDALTQAELDKRRQERLLHQFAEYLATAKGGRPLKEVRKEAWSPASPRPIVPFRYADILAVGRKLPKRPVEDSPDIDDFVDIAEAKVEV